MPTPRVGQSNLVLDFEFSGGHDDDIVLTPRMISEVNTRLLKRKQIHIPTRTRLINFTSNHNEISLPTNHPYSPPILS